jgi:hypothetical protein
MQGDLAIFLPFFCTGRVDHVAVAYFGQFLCSNLQRLEKNLYWMELDWTEI